MIDRREDILPLAHHFLKTLSETERILSPSAEQVLLDHTWPGNVRELENRIQRAIVVGSHSEIQVEDFGFESGRPETLTPVDEVERRRVIDALDNSRGVVAHAADILGISRQALYRKMSKLGVEVQRRARTEGPPL